MSLPTISVLITDPAHPGRDALISISVPPRTTVRWLAAAAASRAAQSSPGLSPTLYPTQVTTEAGTLIAPSDDATALAAQLCGRPVRVELKLRGAVDLPETSLRAEAAAPAASLLAAAATAAEKANRPVPDSMLLRRVTSARAPWAASAFASSADERAAAKALLIAERQTALAFEATMAQATEAGLAALLSPSLTKAFLLLSELGPVASQAAVDDLITSMWPFVRVSHFFSELEVKTSLDRLRKAAFENLAPLSDVFRHYCASILADTSMHAPALRSKHASDDAKYPTPLNNGLANVHFGMPVAVRARPTPVRPLSSVLARRARVPSTLYPYPFTPAPAPAPLVSLGIFEFRC